MPNTRIDWLDAARGIGILLVVFGHTERGLGDSGIGHWDAIDYVLYTFHMPLFFLLAGLNSPRGLAAGRVAYLVRKAPIIIYPYFLWSLIQTSVMIAAAAFTNGNKQWSDLLYIGWLPLSQFWFLYALMLCHVVLALTGMRKRLLIAIGVAALIASQFFENDTLIERFLFSLPFFILSALVSERISRPGPSAKGWVAALLWLAFVPVALGTRNLFGADYSTLQALPATALGIAATLETARSLPRRLSSVFVLMGLASMSIYVMHIIAAAGTRALLMKLDMPPLPWAYVSICTAVGVGVPIVAHFILQHLGILHYFGLAPPPRDKPGAPTTQSA